MSVRKLLTSIVLAILGVLMLGQDVFAQSRGNRYQPSRPTVSPYLYLTRNDTAGMPNYYAFVKPLERQNAINQAQQTEIQSIDRELLVRPTTSAATGTNSTFMNYSHYFPTGGGNGKAQAKQRR